MRVRYSYLSQQFGNCPDLWKKLKQFVATGDFTLGKELKTFEIKFAKSEPASNKSSNRVWGGCTRYQTQVLTARNF